MASYFKNIAEGVKSTLTGMGLTLRHAREARRRRKSNNIQLNDFFEVRTGMVTVQYPQETVPIPDNGRYRLHNEIEDCIVCDKCAKVCPVDCIDIEPIKATEEVGRASDGSVIRLYAARFDIDMAKCCYCGLCTTVCPTECLTMTKTFDYSEFDVREMVYAYSNLTPEEAQEKRELLEQFQMEKAQGKARAAAPAEAPAAGTPAAAAKPAFRPVMKPKATAAPTGDVNQEKEKPTKSAMPFHPRNWNPGLIGNPERFYFTYGKQHPLKRAADTPDPIQSAIKAASAAGFRPTIKPAGATSSPGAAPTSKPAFRPTMKPKGGVAAEPENKADTQKPAFRPTMKPKGGVAAEPENKTEAQKPAFRPTMKPKATEAADTEKIADAQKPAFRPTMKPKGSVAAEPENKTEAQKPAFRPTMKPKGGVAAEPENKTEAQKPAFRPTMKSRTTEAADTGETTDTAKPAFRPTIKPKRAGESAKPENKAEASDPAFRPAADFSIPQSDSRPAFRPPHTAEGDHIPAAPANTKFSPAGYKPLKSAARPSFGAKLPAALVAPQQPPAEQAPSPAADTPAASTQPAARPKATFRPTMKPRK